MKRCVPTIIIIVFFLALSVIAVYAKDNEVKASFMKAPLSFIKNDGQKDPSILFYEQGRGHVTAFSKEGIFFLSESFLKSRKKVKTLKW